MSGADPRLSMYGQMWANINRHIELSWQPVALLALVGASVGATLKGDIPAVVVQSFGIIVGIWFLAHVWDSNAWFWRNHMVIALIEMDLDEDQRLSRVNPYVGEIKDDWSQAHLVPALFLQASLAWLTIMCMYIWAAYDAARHDHAWSWKGMVAPSVLLGIGSIWVCYTLVKAQIGYNKGVENVLEARGKDPESTPEQDVAPKETKAQIQKPHAPGAQSWLGLGPWLRDVTLVKLAGAGLIGVGGAIMLFMTAPKGLPVDLAWITLPGRVLAVVAVLAAVTYIGYGYSATKGPILHGIGALSFTAILLNISAYASANADPRYGQAGSLIAELLAGAFLFALGARSERGRAEPLPRRRPAS